MCGMRFREGLRVILRNLVWVLGRLEFLLFEMKWLWASSLGGKYLEFSCGYIKFEMFVGYVSGDVEWVVGFIV